MTEQQMRTAILEYCETNGIEIEDFDDFTAEEVEEQYNLINAE
jgi:alpha-D-ribose 1-methylphosphonate 5-triphosphate diphosphatase PhnM